MPFIRRSEQGTLVSLHRSDEGGLQFLPEDHPEVRAFLAAAPDAGPEAPEQFAALDADFVRVIEDVIDTLISKNVINITDLPLEAQTKLFSRKSYRERATHNPLDLFGKGPQDRP